jgi:hypothetical protein
VDLKAPLASPTFTGTLTTAGLTATGSTSLQTTTINGSCGITGTLTANSVAISTTNGLTTPIVNLSDYSLGTVYNGAIFQQNQNMTIRSYNTMGTSTAATNIMFVTMDASSNPNPPSTMILSTDSIQLKQPTTIKGFGQLLQIANGSSGGIMSFIDASGNIFSAGNAEFGNTSLLSIDCSNGIVSRGGLNVSSGNTYLQSTTITGTTSTGFITGDNGLSITSGNTSLQNVSLGDANYISFGRGVSPKLKLYDNGDTSYIIGINTDTLYYLTTQSGSHQFYCNTVSGMVIPNLQISTGGTQINGLITGTNGLTISSGNTSLQATTISSLTVTGTTNGLSFNATSDYRIKENVHKIPSYPNIDNLNPVTYKNAITGKQDMGFIAHELQEHFPFLVSGEKDGPENQSVNYIGLIALLTKEIQDLKARIFILEERDASNQTR